MMQCMTPAFRVGVTPDFYTDAKGRFETAVEHELQGIEWGPMPPQPGKRGTPDALDLFDAILALGIHIDAQSLRGVERLALVSRWGVGYNTIDTAALTEADVALAITPGSVRRPVAEAILTLIFGLTTNLLQQDRIVRSGKWRGDLPHLGRNIKGRVLGSVGCGNIALELFRMVQSLGFERLLAYDPYITPERARSLRSDLGVELVSLDQLLRESDFVTINALLNSETEGLIGAAELRMMKPAAYLINTARGPLVQEPALLQALREKWIAGAGLDVFEVEPLPLGSPFRELDNVILAPHGLAWTEEIVRDTAIEACANIRTIAKGEVPASIVNRDVLQRPGFLRKLERYKGEK